MDRVRTVGGFTPPRKVQKPRPPVAIQRGKTVVSRSGPGLPPPGFAGGPMSLFEWYLYWAFLKVKGPPGENSWAYQVGANGGRRSGGAIIDFVVWDQEPRLAVRAQGSRYHVSTTRRNQMYDERSKRMLERLGYKVIDIWEDYVIGDKSGQSAIKRVHMALQGLQDPNPITAPESLARPGRV